MGSATTKQDMIKRVATETDKPRNVVRQIVQAFLDGIIDELAHGRRLEFRDFGVFEVVRRKARVARNPRTGDAIHVPAKAVAHFKQGRVMKDRVASFGEAHQSMQGREEGRGPALGSASSRPGTGSLGSSLPDGAGQGGAPDAFSPPAT